MICTLKTCTFKTCTFNTCTFKTWTHESRTHETRTHKTRTCKRTWIEKKVLMHTWICFEGTSCYAVVNRPYRNCNCRKIMQILVSSIVSSVEQYNSTIIEGSHGNRFFIAWAQRNLVLKRQRWRKHLWVLRKF